MKKFIIAASIILIGVISLNAQQATNTSAVKQATPVMKVDAAKPASTNVPTVSNAEFAKGTCQGKPAAQCSHGKQECTKGEAKAACCQKTATGQTCTHAASEKAKTKAE